MKVYISADLEGIGGILTKEQVTKGFAEYNEACRLLSLEVYHLVEGLVLSGVDEVCVYDAHGTGINILYDYMHPKAKYIMGYSHPGERFPFLDSTFDFIILQGYHAMAGTEKAILDHTYSSADIHNIYVNGKRAGEIYIDALVASETGVPVALVTGDDKAVAEALDVMPWVKTCETKKAVARHCALVKPPSAVRENLRDLAGILIAESKTFKLLSIPPKIEIRFETVICSNADAVKVNGRDVVRLDGRTILKTGEKVWDTYQK